MQKKRKIHNKHLNDLLRGFQTNFSVQDQSCEKMWKEVVDSNIFAQTRVLGLDKGVLTVAVKNSTLYSLLSTYEKKRLTEELRARFPAKEISNIRFKMG